MGPPGIKGISIVLNPFARLTRYCTNLSISGVDTWQIDLADELDGRRLVGIFVATVHLERVDAVLVNTLFSISASMLLSVMQ